MTKKSTKLTISDGIHIFGLILLAISVFIGANFLNSGNLALSIPITIIIIGGLYGIVYALLKLKNGKTSKSARRWQQLVFLFFYTIIAGASFYCFNHFMNTQFGPKKELKLAGKDKINTVTDLVAEYGKYISKTEASFKIDLDAPAVNPDFINMKAASFRLKLEGESKSTIDKANEFISSSNIIIDYWNPITIPSFFNEAEATITRYRDDLITASKSHEFSKVIPFKFDLNQNNNFEILKKELTTFDLKRSNIIQNVIAFLFLHFLILWVYIFKFTGGGGKVKVLLKDNTILM